MKKKSILWLFIMLPLIAQGKREVVYTRLQSLYSNAGILTMDKVALSDTATVMYFTAKGTINSGFQFAPTTYLIDEEGKRYLLKGAVGLTVGKPSYIPKTGQMEFSLLFEPMPTDTKLFDLVEGADEGMFRIYGIHDAKVNVKIPVAEEVIDPEETAEAMFRKGTAVVRGKIEWNTDNRNAGVMFFNFAKMGEADIVPYEMTRQCAILQKDGTFYAELSLDHPVWADMTLKGMSPISFYVRPGDTLDITAKKTAANDMAAEYASSHPKGCYASLLKHQDVPFVLYSWERLTQNEQNLSNEHFLKEVEACVAENMRLCDYFAWKYRFSPWETHLLKNRQRLVLTERNLLLASRLFETHVQVPRNRVVEAEDFIGYDYSAFKLLNIFPSLDDPSLSFMPDALGYPSVLNKIPPVTFATSYASFNKSPEGVDVPSARDYTMMETVRLQVEAIRDLTGMEGVPWAVQAFLTSMITRLYDFMGPEERENFVSYVSSYLTYPFFQKKIVELNRLIERSASWLYELPEGKGYQSIKNVLDDYKGRYVQMVFLDSPKEDYRFYNNTSVRNLALNYNKNNSDLVFLVIVNRDVYAGTKELDRLQTGLNRPRLMWFGNETFLEMQSLLRFSGVAAQRTFDRNGLVFKRSLDMTNETYFRQCLRNILEAENKMPK